MSSDPHLPDIGKTLDAWDDESVQAAHGYACWALKEYADRLREHGVGEEQVMTQLHAVAVSVAFHER